MVAGSGGGLETRSAILRARDASSEAHSTFGVLARRRVLLWVAMDGGDAASTHAKRHDGGARWPWKAGMRASRASPITAAQLRTCGGGRCWHQEVLQGDWNMPLVPGMTLGAFCSKRDGAVAQ